MGRWWHKSLVVDDWRARAFIKRPGYYCGCCGRGRAPSNGLRVLPRCRRSRVLNVEALEGPSQVVSARRLSQVEVPGANKALVVFGVDEKPKLEKRTATSIEEAKSMAQTFHDATPNDPYESTSLLRALLVSTPSQEHVLYLSCNHAITDGWSHQVLYGELVRAYNARVQGSAAPFGHEERPYAAWLSEQLRLCMNHAKALCTVRAVACLAPTLPHALLDRLC